MSTPNNTVPEWLLSSDFYSIFPEAKPFAYSSSVFTALPSNVFQRLLGFWFFENTLHNLWKLVLAVVKSSLPQRSERRDVQKTAILFVQQFCGEVSAAGGIQLDPVLQHLQCSLPDCSKARGGDTFSPAFSLWFLHLHTCVHILRHILQLLYVQSPSRVSPESIHFLMCMGCSM